MIKILDNSVVAQWDDYVENSPSSTFFHKAGWKEVIEKAFGHKTYFLYAEDNGKITGILPLVHINSLLFGNSLSSCAFCVYGGIIADNETAY
ncbi:MAG: peptidoglycan bridge formation protein FemAB, partial [Methylomarinum sp.]|nr:peptidoglycan bridge formation protein FemAB [Methylomarinum sp.]